MTNRTLSILIVDDDPTNREFLSEILGALGCATETATEGGAALERLARDPPPDVVLLDLVMAGLDGMETLRRYRGRGGRVPVVICSALEEISAVQRAVRAGATDYLTKPFDAEELREVLERVTGRLPGGAPAVAAAAEGGRDGPPAPIFPAALPTPPGRSFPSGGTTASTLAPIGGRLGVSPAMQAVDALVERIADADVPVLITGESGVGKDVVAREIHARSSRAVRPLIKINCAALPAELLESELFGHERGSFTGADRSKPGQFELADGGTLFLDEIGEMPVVMQAKLLQALQDGEFYRVGGQRKVKVDVRVLVATNVDLGRAIERGTFREDLYYRLNVVHIAIPPLRERREDIPRLLAAFIEKYGKRYGRTVEEIPRGVIERLERYQFPGNIRELENLVRRLIVLRDPQYVLSELRDRPAGAAATGVTGLGLGAPLGAMAPAQVTTPLSFPVGQSAVDAIARQVGGETAEEAVDGGSTLRIDLKDLGRKAANAAEREAIALMLRCTGGNKREAAERLGISYKAILYKIRDFGLGPRRPRRPPPLTPLTGMTASAPLPPHAAPDELLVGAERALAASSLPTISEGAG